MHGEVKFSIPLQCSHRGPADVDDALLKALDLGCAANCETIERLMYALEFVDLANTDDSLMTERAETILIGSAFEQLLGANDGAYELGCRFGGLFESYGSVTVEEARKVRLGIKIDERMRKRADAQLKWYVHRKWIEELYDVRSKSVHESTATNRSWGWTPLEHLVMAAWVFPLVVKLLLQRDGLYTLSDTDKGHCMTVDKLLAVIDWAERTDYGASMWNNIVSSTVMEYTLTAGLKDCIPPIFNDDSLKKESGEP